MIPDDPSLSLSRGQRTSAGSIVLASIGEVDPELGHFWQIVPKEMLNKLEVLVRSCRPLNRTELPPDRMSSMASAAASWEVPSSVNGMVLRLAAAASSRMDRASLISRVLFSVRDSRSNSQMESAASPAALAFRSIVRSSWDLRSRAVAAEVHVVNVAA